MKILVIEVSNLGDAILTWPALQRLQTAFPGAEFHVLASPRTLGLFEGDPQFRRVWRWERESSPFWQVRLVVQLIAQRFGLVVDFRNSIIPLFLFGARRTPMLQRSSRAGVHRVEQHLCLLAGLGIPALSDGPFPIWTGEEDRRWVERFIIPRVPLMVVSPGSRSHLKRWGAEKFARVADRLAAEHSAQIILVGDESECPISKAVRDAMTMKGKALDLTGQTTVRQLAALLARAHLVVTNDSACLHAAEAMGAPTLAIFGPTDEKKYGPRGKRSAVVRRRLVCAPCELALCPYGHECMKWLEVNEVYEAAAKILKNGSAG